MQKYALCVWHVGVAHATAATAAKFNSIVNSNMSLLVGCGEEEREGKRVGEG